MFNRSSFLSIFGVMTCMVNALHAEDPKPVRVPPRGLRQVSPSGLRVVHDLADLLSTPAGLGDLGRPGERLLV